VLGLDPGFIGHQRLDVHHMLAVVVEFKDDFIGNAFSCDPVIPKCNERVRSRPGDAL
jgi:hypothetical protein